MIAPFDGALKAFRTPDGKRATESTEGLVHNAVLLPATRGKIKAIEEKYDRELAQLSQQGGAAAAEEERYANREACKREVQRVVVKEGQIYLAALPRAVQDFLR